MSPPVDLLVIGGGIHGACVARDAARRGLSVTLVEKGDLAQGTSSRSSKLVHGGLRYLETGQFGLVRDALAERAVLLRTAPHLVHPLPFLLPFHRGAKRPAWLVRAGLTLYDRLAGAGVDAPGRLPRHRRLTVDEALAREPDLPREGLTGAALYHDAQMDDAALVVANAIDAARAGADVRTRTKVVKLDRAPGGAGHGVRVTLEDGVIDARLVVNAAGPWADLGHLRLQARPRTMRLSRGTHFVVPALTRGHALLLFARDHRVFFVLPWGDHSLVGTTDVPFSGHLEHPEPSPYELRTLRDEIGRRWPGRAAPVTRVFAGVRALLPGGLGAASTSLSREARIREEDGVLSLLGGKYTTARSLAQRAVDRVVALLGRPARACDTATAPLPGRAGAIPDDALVDWAIDEAFARRVEDVVWRRSALWLDRAAARAAAPAIAARMAARLGWSGEQRAAEVRAVDVACDEEERWLAGPT